MKTRFLALITAALTLAGCTTVPAVSPDKTPPASQYDTPLVHATTGAQLSVQQLANEVASADIVVVGEYHGHHGAHLLQARLQQALHTHNPNQLLTMEQFNLDHQQALDDYLAGQTGETEMIEDSQAWDNYRASYRPLVEFARQHQIPVIAANAPANVVRCVGRKGPDYLNNLEAPRREELPDSPFEDTPAYQQKFVEAIRGSHGTGEDELSERMLNTYRAQLLRDNTMAHRILQARARYPQHQVLHVTGTFHSEERLGTVAALENQAPDLNIVVVSPVEWPKDLAAAPLDGNQSRGDYLYFIQPLPEAFKDKDRERKAMQERFSHSKAVDCE